MTRLGYLYLHAPDPKNPGQYVTYPIAVEVPEDANDEGEGEEGEANDGQA